MWWSKSIKQQQEEERQAKIDAEFRKDAEFNYFDRISAKAIEAGKSWEQFEQENPWVGKYPAMWHKYAIAADRFERRMKAAAEANRGNNGDDRISDEKVGNDMDIYGKSSLERQRIEAENDFIGKATQAINEGVSFNKFLEKNKQYSLMPGKWQQLYSDVMGMRKMSKNGGILPLDALDVLQKISNRRAAADTKVWKEKYYQDNRDSLLKAAASRKPWTQVRHELDIDPECGEKLYRRAQQELGYQPNDNGLKDTSADAFYSGFFGD